MKFELEETLRGEPDEVLLDDLRRCAQVLGRETITMAEYAEIGRAHPSTSQRRFRSWPNALRLAGLQPSRSQIGISDDGLFENIKTLWISLGRQPRYGEVKKPRSRFAAGTYEKRFGSWTKALRAFIQWVNADDVDSPADATETARHVAARPLAGIDLAATRPRRDISERQRFRILLRDGFQCRTCGASPLAQRGIELHIDHIVPWSKGGDTTDANLETKCARCNLGKGNAFDA
jgi:hypothetical protein